MIKHLQAEVHPVCTTLAILLVVAYALVVGA